MMGCVTLVVITVWVVFCIYVTKVWGWGPGDPGLWGLSFLGLAIGLVLRHFIIREQDRNGS